MANEIPPFLPASPPPMCKLDFDEDDDEDEFGDFSIASESCYHDNVSVSKVTSDNELNNTKQVFDPGAIYIEAFPNHENSLNHNIISNGIKENSFDDFGENYENGSCTNLPVGKLSLENQSDTEIDVFNSTEKCHNDNLDVTSESHVPIDSIANNTVPPVDVLPSSAVTNCNGISADTNSIEEDSSIDDSISINCDKNSAANNDTNSINFENEELENDENIPSFVATEDGIENESPSKCTESTSTADDFTFFKGVESEEKPSSTRISPPSSVTESNTSQRRMSEDSDDSNVPDIDFSCFITCPNEIENENISKEDDFGDFAGPPEINFFNKTIDDSSPSHSNATLDLPDDQIRPNRLNPVPQVTIGQIPVEQCNDADDDFADFVSTNCQPLVNNNPQIDEDEFESFSDCYSKTDSFQCAVQKEPSFAPQVESNSAKTYDLDMECWNEVFQVQAQEQIEVNLNTFEGKLNGSSVWCKIKEIESSPALTYNWNNSETQKMLLSALYVDSRNILFGPRWNSEVPRFASNLGFSPLVPQKALDKKDDQPVEHIKHPPAENISLIDDNIAPHVPGSVPEAHFDWNNSGLTNPLDSYSHSSLLDLDLLASFDIHSPYYKTNRKNEKRKAVDLNPTSYENSLFAKTPHRENLSEEAKEVLNNLPNLYVMEKQYIVFPVS